MKFFSSSVSPLFGEATTKRKTEHVLRALSETSFLSAAPLLGAGQVLVALRFDNRTIDITEPSVSVLFYGTVEISQKGITIDGDEVHRLSRFSAFPDAQTFYGQEDEPITLSGEKMLEEEGGAAVISYLYRRPVCELLPFLGESFGFLLICDTVSASGQTSTGVVVYAQIEVSSSGELSTDYVRIAEPWNRVAGSYV